MTSNVGAAELSRTGALGFGGGSVSDPGADKLMSAAKRTFKPEFLNRVDDIVVFRKLEEQDLVSIVELELAALRKRLEERSLSFEIDVKAKEFIVAKGNASEYGARPLRRAVERFLEDPLSEALLRGEFEKASGVKVTAGSDGLILTPVTAKAKAKAKTGTKPKAGTRNGAKKKQ